jgi:hypothetical protein
MAAFSPDNEGTGAGRDLLEEVREATAALSAVATDDRVPWPGTAAALRATCDDVIRRLGSKELAVLVVGPPDGGKRTLINTALGAEILPPEAGEPPTVVRVRQGDDAHYACELKGGGAQSLPSALRERTHFLDEAVVRAERELSEAERELGDLRERKRELRGRAEATHLTGSLLSLASIKRLAWRLANWLAALVVAFIARGRTWRRRLGGKAGERTVALPVAEPAKPLSLTKEARFERVLEVERGLLDAEPRALEAKKALARARSDQADHLAERGRTFLRDVQALTDAASRGGEIDEITIDHPAELLPPGLVLVDAPELVHGHESARDATWARIRDDLGGCIVVSPGGRTNILAPDLVTRISPIMPHGVRGLVHGVGTRADARTELASRLRAELVPLFARIREESPTLVAAFATRAVCERLGVLTEACATAGIEIEAKIAETERQRDALVSMLRTRTRELTGAAVDAVARTVLDRARSTLQTRINDLADEWRDEIAGADDRASVDACIARINESAPARLSALCDSLADQVARDAQAASRMLQRALFDELLGAERRSLSTETLAALTMPDAALFEAEGAAPSVPGKPLGATHDAFERKRVGIGLGGAAAGAALGTLIFPGIGTAVGAMVGVLAGLVEGTGSLKRRAIEHVRAHGAAVEREIATRLDVAVPNMARDLATSVDDALERAIARREGSLARLFDDSDRALARELGKKDELLRLRASLATHEERFVALADRARAALEALARARGA